jgi:predicted CXXCH cytochrome family protein
LRQVLLGLLFGVSLHGMAAGEGRTPKPVVEAAKAGTLCVAPPDVMRRNHMDFLKHQRDDTVHGGIRGAKFSLKGCIDCHASQKTQSVAKDESNFCVSCHSYAAVKIDCFECHTPKARTVAHGGKQ